MFSKHCKPLAEPLYESVLGDYLQFCVDHGLNPEAPKLEQSFQIAQFVILVDGDKPLYVINLDCLDRAIAINDGGR